MSASAFEQIRIVLVNTSHPGNIGGVARAMKNMGLSRLYLVEPRNYPAEKAVWRAAGALDVLDKAVVVDSLDEAIADCSLVIGTSARDRRIPWPMLDPRQCGEQTWREAGEHQVALLFGREDRGLTNDELHKCHYHVHIPANADYSSLNLAAAVQVIAYEVRMAYLAAERSDDNPPGWDQPPAKTEALEHYYAHLQETLEELGFLQPGNPRQTMTRLRRLYNRVRPDDMELSILRGVLTATRNYIYYAQKRLDKGQRAEQGGAESRAPGPDEQQRLDNPE